jgi:hypothetical protein
MQLLILLLNESIVLSIGCRKDFHDIKWQNSKCKRKFLNTFPLDTLSIFYIPLGKIKLYLIAYSRRLWWCICKKLETEYTNFQEIEKEIDKKLKEKEWEFLQLRKEEKEYWIKEMEKLLSEINRAIENARNKGYIFFSVTLVFTSIIGSSLFKFFDFIKNMFNISKLFFFIELYLSVHIAIYIINIVIFSIYLFKLTASISRTFRDFRSESSYELAYFKDLYFQWYFKRNFEHKRTTDLVYYIQRYVIYTLTFILITFILSTTYLYVYQDNTPNKFTPIPYDPCGQILIAEFSGKEMLCPINSGSHCSTKA